MFDVASASTGTGIETAINLFVTLILAIGLTSAVGAIGNLGYKILWAHDYERLMPGFIALGGGLGLLLGARAIAAAAGAVAAAPLLPASPAMLGDAVEHLVVFTAWHGAQIALGMRLYWRLRRGRE